MPEGKPHAGEMAMDATAQRLINEAYELFGGHEPAPEQTTTVRQAALERAVTQLGVTESPPDSNQCKYTQWYGMVGPWCAMFTSWCYDLENDSPSFLKGSYYAYVPYIVGDARSHVRGLSVTGDPLPGDLVCYDWGWDGEFDHVGLFEAWASGSGSTFTAIEGNTSLDNNSNGGEVMRRTRRVPDQNTVFVRVAEP